MSQFTDELRAQVDAEFEAQKAEVIKARSYAKLDEMQNEVNAMDVAANTKREEVATVRAELDQMYTVPTPVEPTQEAPIAIQ